VRRWFGARDFRGPEAQRAADCAHAAARRVELERLQAVGYSRDAARREAWNAHATRAMMKAARRSLARGESFTAALDAAMKAAHS